MKIRLVQCHSEQDINSNIAYAKAVLEKSAAQNFDLVVFPELFLSGYIATANTKSIAISSDSKVLGDLQAICAANDIACALGFPRKDNENIYNSACFIDRNGTPIGIYDKTHLFGDEKLYFSFGNELKVFDTSFGKIGLLICYDIEFPEAARALAMSGAEMIVCISANMKPYDDLHKTCVISRAIENSLPIVYCNYSGKDNKFSYVGQSNIIHSNGKCECKFSKRKKILSGTLNIPESCKDDNMNYLKNLRDDLYKY
ncbi:MAG: carbon-nitrogen hydrolase family protein [Clostridia bacterium]|nr:carbon-nitrogen hydrolase family protein [Clostridia bacterium]